MSMGKKSILSIVGLAVILAMGCTTKENHYVPSPIKGPQGPQGEVTGKGNGGNEMKMSVQEIEAKLAKVKPYLHMVFKGLRDLNQAEQLSPGLTELKSDPELQELVELMTRETEEYMNVFGDIEVADNFKPQKEACIDINGDPNAAAAEAGNIGGEICFSLDRLQAASIKGADFAVDVLVLSLAAHEFGHHYLNSGDDQKDEALVRRLQDFVTSQMNKYQALATDSNIVTASDIVYLDRFVFEAKAQLEKATASNVIQAN